jgi:hypothetical protein
MPFEPAIIGGFPFSPGNRPDEVFTPYAIREAVREGNVGLIVVWLYLMMQWWGLVCLVGPALTFLALGPRLLAPHLVGLVVLWTAMGGVVACGAWWVKRNRLRGAFSPRRAETIDEKGLVAGISQGNDPPCAIVCEAVSSSDCPAPTCLFCTHIRKGVASGVLPLEPQPCKLL